MKKYINKINKIRILLFLGIIFFISYYLESQIANTKHNLSINGPGTYKASSESQVCIFCHTPHNSASKKALWNRNNSSANYSLYTSDSKHATIVQPDGSSVLCLSCHDGSIALGSTVSNGTITMSGGITTLPSAIRSNLTTDLTNDHPISFTYDAALVTANGQLKSPSSLPTAISLESNKMQCTSCHDPHNNTNGSFLNVSHDGANAGYLCTACHDVTNWSGSLHKTQANTSWNNSGTTPWPHSTYTNMVSNACENCHNPHKAGGAKMNLNYSAEETNCLNCHNGNLLISGVGIENISAEFQKTYKHGIASYTGVHSPTESTIPSTKHVECVDCHNPHQANNSNATASAPTLKGSLAGVSGVDQGGNAVTTASYEYEICYKCHSTSTFVTASTSRNIVQANTRLEFATNSISFHPVAGANSNANNASLLTGWSLTSRVYCSDCHSSNTTSIKGPHGSTNVNILKGTYVKTDGTNYNVNNFTLCWNCHSSTTVVSSNTSSFRRHQLHIVDEDTPCNVCHDAHGIASSQGTTSGNSHLINFQTGVVTGPNGTGSGYYVHQPTPTVKGRCYLTCHGESHNPESY